MAAVDSRYFQTEDGLRLHYCKYQGPASGSLTLVCLPGLTRNGRDFDTLAADLSTRYHVICPDFRGRGRSEYATSPTSYVPRSYVRDLSALVQVLGGGPVVLVGTSLGGLVGTLFASIWPQRVLGLVLNDVGPEIDPAGLKRIAGYVGKTPPVKTWNDAATALEIQDRAVYPDYGSGDWMRTARRRYVEGSDGTVKLDYDLTIARMFSDPASTPEQWPFFNRLHYIPTLLIRGAHSDILTRETMLRMKQAVPSLQSVEVPNRGHTPTLEEPVARSAIATFLEQLSKSLPTTTRLRRVVSSWLFQPAARRAGVL